MNVRFCYVCRPIYECMKVCVCVCVYMYMYVYVYVCICVLSMYGCRYVCTCFFHGSTAVMCQGILIVEVSTSHSDTPQSVNTSVDE
jgi:hypothetical protein